MLEFNLARKKKYNGAPTFIGGSAFDGPSSGSVLMPSGLQAGDFLLIFADAVGVVNVPSGWTRFSSTTWSYGYNRALLYKIATGGETNFTITQSSSYEIIGCIVAYRGPTQVVAYANQEQSVNYSYASLTATANNSTLVTHASDRSPTIPTYPAGEASRVNYLGLYFGIRTADELVNAGPTGTRAANGGSVYNGYMSNVLIA